MGNKILQFERDAKGEELVVVELVEEKISWGEEEEGQAV